MVGIFPPKHEMIELDHYEYYGLIMLNQMAIMSALMFLLENGSVANTQKVLAQRERLSVELFKQAEKTGKLIRKGMT